MKPARAKSNVTGGGVPRGLPASRAVEFPIDSRVTIYEFPKEAKVFQRFQPV